jgi:acetyl-CoA carboxylase carboxyl transferase subunit alpha
MLEYSTYTVITPEGCATILWKSSEYASAAAEAMGVTSKRLEELGIVDSTIEEPLGGAHRDVPKMSANIKEALIEQVDRLSGMDTDQLIARRYDRLMSYGISN